MAKKKNSPVVYTPLVNTSNTKLPEINQTFQEIPRYEDAGVKYLGKYKIQKGVNNYELRGQIPYQIYYLRKFAALDQIEVNENNWDIPANTIFYASDIQITYKSSNSTGYFLLYSLGKSTASDDNKTLIGIYHGADGQVHHVSMNFPSRLPYGAIRKLGLVGFQSDYEFNTAGIYAYTNFNANDFVSIVINGWLEEVPN